MNATQVRTGLVVVTHGQIGRSLIEVAEFILDQSLSDIAFISFRQSAMGATGEREIRGAIEAADRGQGVLILTDIGGASPCNTVARLLPSERGNALVNGLNLAMLIRAWNYRDQPPGKLARLAAEGGTRDIGTRPGKRTAT